MRRLLSIIAILAGVAFGLTAFAGTLTERAVHLDEATIRRGYTISDSENHFRVGILPDVLSDAAWVKVRKLDSADFPMPENRTLVSDIFQYDIRVPNPQVLIRPIALSLQYDSAIAKGLEFRFYNRVSGAWQLIPANFDHAHGTVRALIHFPFAQVAVFAPQIGAPELASGSAIVIDRASGKVLFEKYSDEIMPIASLTKLMTAIVFLKHNPGWETEVVLAEEDMAGGAKLYASVGESLTVRDLFHTTLIGSANNTAKALARSTGLSKEDFVAEMNATAKQLGMPSAMFIEPSGLDPRNSASARDIARLADEALKFFDISQATSTRSYSFAMKNTGRPHNIKNTNLLVHESSLYILGGKTGYLEEAGNCLVTRARNSEGKEVTAVVLQHPSMWRSGAAGEVEALLLWSLQQ
ncbi:MAG: serine hydrolase [bacterium]|nr:serine hydrolase [bacterium]